MSEYCKGCKERQDRIDELEARFSDSSQTDCSVDSIFEANDELQSAIEKMCEEKTILPDTVREKIGRASNLLATYCLLNPQNKEIYVK